MKRRVKRSDWIVLIMGILLLLGVAMMFTAEQPRYLHGYKDGADAPAFEKK